MIKAIHLRLKEARMYGLGYREFLATALQARSILLSISLLKNKFSYSHAPIDVILLGLV